MSETPDLRTFKFVGVNRLFCHTSKIDKLVPLFYNKAQLCPKTGLPEVISGDGIKNKYFKGQDYGGLYFTYGFLERGELFVTVADKCDPREHYDYKIM